jgi:UDP-GlcNAc:undecaprenyl-phosphate GlcNAc-1-phosphate transferase
MASYVLVFSVAFLLSLGLTPITRRLGHRLGIVDRPGGRRTHRGEISRMGGVALLVAFVLALGAAAWRGDLTRGYSAGDFTRLSGLLVGGLAACVFGLVDDRLDLPPGPQFFFQFLLSLVALGTLLWLERFTLPTLGLVALSDYAWGPWLYVPLTILWVMGMMNTVNWLDGLDGLAAGVGAILCLVLAVHMHRVGQPSVALLPLALLGALLGFLPYNAFPAVLLVMGLPVVDVAWQIFDRLRHRRSPTQADRGHLHFRLRDLGFSERAIVFAYWGFCALFGALALIVSSWLYKLIALLTIGIGVVILLAYLSRDEGNGV